MYLHVDALLTFSETAQVLVDLFRHDLRLWKAYSMTLQVSNPLVTINFFVRLFASKLFLT